MATNIVTFRAKTGQQLFSLLNHSKFVGLSGECFADLSRKFGPSFPLLAHELVGLLVSTFAPFATHQAGVAQLVEQLICNHQVVGSSPITGSNINLIRMDYA